MLQELENYFNKEVQIAESVLKARGDKAAMQSGKNKYIQLSRFSARFTTFNTGGNRVSTPKSVDPKPNRGLVKFYLIVVAFKGHRGPISLAVGNACKIMLGSIHAIQILDEQHCRTFIGGRTTCTHTLATERALVALWKGQHPF